MPLEDDRLALERLIIDNSDLEALEAHLDRFNIFEAVGVVSQEVRHSDCLSFLLDPQERHGLGDWLLKRVLQKTLQGLTPSAAPISAIDLDIWSLDSVLVYREWHSIDVMLVDESHRLVVAIENKVFSSEHSDQLSRYRREVRTHFPDWHALFLYLTPEGELPSDEHYLPLSYRTIVELVEELVARRSGSLGNDICTLLSHYSQMVRRHIVGDPGIDALCQRIYAKHRRALDMIFERRPDLQSAIHDELVQLIMAEPDIIIDTSSKAIIRFLYPEWDAPELLRGEGWTPSRRMLLWEIKNGPNYVLVSLYVGPGPIETRQALLEFANAHRPLFQPTSKTLYAKWNSLYLQHWFKTKDLTEDETDAILEKLRQKWSQFRDDKLIPIREALAEAPWASAL